MLQRSSTGNNGLMRSLATWIVVGALAATAIVLAVLFVTGAGTANQAGKPLGVPAVSITPGPSAAPTPTPDPSVVEGPPPVAVQLDDHGGDNGNSGSGNSGSDNGGSSGKGGGSDD